MDIAIVYPVAGMSSRFGGKIKALANVSDNKSLIEYSLEQAIPAGFTKIIFIVSENTEQPIKEKLGDNYNGIPIEYCRQEYDKSKREKPWGTTDALCSAKEVLDCPFVFCNGDDLYGKDSFKILVNHIRNKDNCATIGYGIKDVLPEEGTVNRGIFQIKDNFVTDLREEIGISFPDLEKRGIKENDLCSMNIFALQPEVMKELVNIMDRFKEKNKEDKKVECLLPVEISNLIKQNKIELEIYKTNDQWFGVTNPGDELKIREQIKK